MRENDSNGRCLMAIRIYSAISKQPKAAYFAINLNAVYTPQKYAIWVVLKHDQLISINMWLLPELRFPKLAYQITSSVYNHRTRWFIEPWTFDCQPRPRLLTRERELLIWRSRMSNRAGGWARTKPLGRLWRHFSSQCFFYLRSVNVTTAPSKRMQTSVP